LVCGRNLKATDKRGHGAVCNTEAHHMSSCRVCSQWYKSRK